VATAAGRDDRVARDDGPRPYGYAEAIHSMGSVAAPLLAGFGLTLVLYTLTATGSFKWANAVLALMMGAALALIGCVQCTVCARLFTPPAGLALDPREERELASAHRVWAARAERLYNLGILLLFGGVTVALVPPLPLRELPPARLLAVAVGLAGLAVAVAWIAAGLDRVGWLAGRLRRERPPRPHPG
jgi:MFS family permease